MAKSQTNWTQPAKTPVNWSGVQKNTTTWAGNSTFEQSVTLGSTTVTLGSTTVTLLGYTAGLHFNDVKNSTNWTVAP